MEIPGQFAAGDMQQPLMMASPILPDDDYHQLSWKEVTADARADNYATVANKPKGSCMMEIPEMVELVSDLADLYPELAHGRKSLTRYVPGPSLETINSADLRMMSVDSLESPDRERKLEELRVFFFAHLHEIRSGSLVISGQAGIGQTAYLILFVVADEFAHYLQCVHLDCTPLTSAGVVYNWVCEALQLQPKSSRACHFFTTIFKHLCSKCRTVLIVLDDLDQLAKVPLSILSAIFDWPAIRQVKLLLVGMSNYTVLSQRRMICFNERCQLMPFLFSFPPYVIRESVTKRAAAKEGKEAPRLASVPEGVFAMQPQLLLSTLLLMARYPHPNMLLTMARTHKVYQRICYRRDITALNLATFAKLMGYIAARTVVRIMPKNDARRSKVVLLWDDDEVKEVLQDSLLIASILDDIPCLGY